MSESLSATSEPQQTSLPSLVTSELNPAVKALTARAAPLIDQVAAALVQAARSAERVISRRPRPGPTTAALGGRQIEFLEDWW